MRIFFVVLLLAMTTACEQRPKWQGSLETLLASQPKRFATVIQNPEKYRVQIMYMQIDRDFDNQPSFKTFIYNMDLNRFSFPGRDD